MRRVWRALLLLLLFFVVSVAIASLFDIDGISPKIVVLPIKGEIQFDGTESFFSSGFSSNDAIKKLNDINEDKSVKGVILEIDSPGGNVVASKQLADKVKSMDKPVVALVKESAASGAYWVASSSDWIVADELSVVGSVGVIGSYLQFSGLMGKYGVGYERLVSGDMKDIGSPYRELTPDEKKMMQLRIDQVHGYFANDVASTRRLSKNSIKKISDGSFYLGMEAKELGLVDEFGNIDVAFNATKGLANVTDAKLVYISRSRSLAEAISKFASESSYVMGRGIGDSFQVSARNELLSV